MSKLYIFSFKNNAHRYYESYGQSAYSLQANSRRMKSSHGHFSLPYLKSKIKEANYKIYNWGSTPLHRALITSKLCTSNLSGHWITTTDSATAMYIKLSVDEFINTRSTCKYVGSYVFEEDEITNLDITPIKPYNDLMESISEVDAEIHKYNNAASYLRTSAMFVSKIDDKQDLCDMLKTTHNEFAIKSGELSKHKEELSENLVESKKNISEWIESKKTAV